jgi:hypothetical protein
MRTSRAASALLTAAGSDCRRRARSPSRAIADAIHARRELLMTIDSAKALSMLTVGDHVRINHHASHRYLQGMHGVIVAIDEHVDLVRPGEAPPREVVSGP